MTTPNTYREPIGRYVVEYLEKLPEAHRAELRLNGIDPDDNWLLSWSFESEGEAKSMAADLTEEPLGAIRQYRVRDRGEDAPRFIERSIW